MKKTIAFVLVLVIILSLAACGAVKEVQESKSLYAHGLEVVSMLSEMTRSESFIGIYTANSEIKDIILALGESSYEQPDPRITTVYRMPVPPTFVAWARQRCFSRSISYTVPSSNLMVLGRTSPSGDTVS